MRSHRSTSARPAAGSGHVRRTRPSSAAGRSHRSAGSRSCTGTTTRSPGRPRRHARTLVGRQERPPSSTSPSGQGSATPVGRPPVPAAETAGPRRATAFSAAENNADGPRIDPGERQPRLSVTQRNGRRTTHFHTAAAFAWLGTSVRNRTRPTMRLFTPREHYSPTGRSCCCIVRAKARQKEY